MDSTAAKIYSSLIAPWSGLRTTVSLCHGSMSNAVVVLPSLTISGSRSFSERETSSPIFSSRKISCPKLEDNEIVKDHPGVRGTSEDIVFLTHNHEDDDGQESVSKVNTLEVRRCRILIHPSRY